VKQSVNAALFSLPRHRYVAATARSKQSNTILLAYVILFKCINFWQYFACLHERIFNCCNVLISSLQLNSSGYLRDYKPQTDANFPILSNCDIHNMMCEGHDLRSSQPKKQWWRHRYKCVNQLSWIYNQYKIRICLQVAEWYSAGSVQCHKDIPCVWTLYTGQTMLTVCISCTYWSSAEVIQIILTVCISCTCWSSAEVIQTILTVCISCTCWSSAEVIQIILTVCISCTCWSSAEVIQIILCDRYTDEQTLRWTERPTRCAQNSTCDCLPIVTIHG